MSSQKTVIRLRNEVAEMNERIADLEAELVVFRGRKGKRGCFKPDMANLKKDFACTDFKNGMCVPVNLACPNPECKKRVWVDEP